MRVDIRKTTPLTREEADEVAVFAGGMTLEHAILARLAPVPVRSNSEGSTLRALTLLGMRYVREHMASEGDIEEAYAELAAGRPHAHAEAGHGLRRNMRRMAAQD